MQVRELEACTSYIALNRAVAERLRRKAGTLLDFMQTIEDLDERLRIADLAEASDGEAAMHTSLADAQERDLGVRCHCSPRAASAADPDIDASGIYPRFAVSTVG